MQEWLETDPVVAEVDVLLSQSLSRSLYLLQYPLRPAHLPYDVGWVKTAGVHPVAHQVRLEMAIPPHGENYSRSRGEGYARDADLARTTPGTPSAYESGLMDKHTLTSPPQPPSSHRYVAGVLKDGELHLCPLRAVVQLRPSLQHLDKAAAGRRRSMAGDSANDGDTTESEGEEIRPVTVKFARRESGTSRSKRVSYTDLVHNQDEDGWVSVQYHPLTSEKADAERRLLFSREDSSINNFCLTPQAYLDMLCPLETQQEVRAPSEPPGVVSLSHLKSLPVPQQVHDLLCSTQVLQLGHLCTLLRCGRGQVPLYLDALQECGVLVQGCWVLSSALAHPTEEEADVRCVRDYILYCFTQNRTIARRDIVVITKVPHETVRQILAPLTSGNGWEFKLPTDHDFNHKHSHIVQQQEEKWRRRYEELKAELGLPREQSKSKQSPGGEEGRRAAAKKGKMVVPLKIKLEPLEEDGVGHPSQLSGTPSHAPTLTPLQPQRPTSVDVGMVSTSGEMESHHPPPQQPYLHHETTATHIKQEDEAVEHVVMFCNEILSRGVLPLSCIKDRLQVHQATVQRGHPLSSVVVSDSVVEEALRKMGAVEVGQPSGQRLFARHRLDTAVDKYRSVVLRLFQTHQCLKRKQVMEAITRECGQQPDTKELNSILKELAYSKGSQWYLLGT